MHKTYFVSLLAGLCTLLAGCSTTREKATRFDTPAPGQQARQHLRTSISRTAELSYLLYLPPDFKKSDEAKWPLLLFLHGAGERGTNLDLVTVHGPPKLVKAHHDFPFILVSPQCPSERTWRDDELLVLLDMVSAKYNVDTNRIYLTGLSMGGYGSWSLASKHPERFAAVAPICGGGDTLPLLLPSPERKRALETLGVWAFHGGKDPVVPLAESERMTNAMKRAGCKEVKLTVYPEAGHDSWTDAYNDRELWKWFLAHQRGQAPGAQ